MMTEERAKKFMTDLLDKAAAVKAKKGPGFTIPMTFATGNCEPIEGHEDRVLLSEPICVGGMPKPLIERVIAEGTAAHPCDFAVLITEAWAKVVPTREEVDRLMQEYEGVHNVPGRRDVLSVHLQTSAGRRYNGMRDVNMKTGLVGTETQWSGFGENEQNMEGHDRFLDRVVWRKRS